MGQVVLKGINKFYESVHAVKDFNLQIRDKEFVVFVGPSGCGKTTTLRMIAGLEAISSGDISIDGQVVNNLAPMDRDIAMVFQNYALYPHMSVFDNMAFGLKMRKFARPEIRKRVKEAADILGIGELLKRKPRQLSGGQRQRVALGRAIVRHPRVFLFDEPLSNLDAKLRVQMRVELKKLHLRLGTTAIYVTHDQVEVMLGVRPEDLTVAGSADPDHLCFDAVIEVVEQLGSEILLDMKVGDGVMVASVEPTARVKVRDKLRIAMRPSRL